MQRDRLYHVASAPSASAEDDVEPVPDSVLLERVAAGEQQAVTALLTRHRPRLYALALRILSDPAEAATVVKSVSQEVVYETRRFSPTQYPVRRWLAEVTRLTALDHLRARTSSSAA